MNVGRREREKERERDGHVGQGEEGDEQKRCQGLRGTAANELPSRFSSSSSCLHQEKGTAVPRPVHNAPYLIDNLCASSYVRFCGGALLYGVYREGDSFVEETNALEVMRTWKDIRKCGKRDKHLDSIF